MVRIIAIVLLAAAALFVVLASSASNVFYVRYPARALTLAPAHAGASANLAQQLYVAGYGDEAEQFAAASFRRSPVAAPPLRTLGLVADSRDADRRALTFFRLAHSMSRRDRPTEAWLIQNALRTSDFGVAIRHFSISMRLGRRGEEQLTPLLVAATEDRRVIAPLRRELAQHPQWKVPFLLRLASLGPDPDHVAVLARGLLDPDKPEEQVALRHLIAQLGDRRRYDLAWTFYREAWGGAPPQPPAGLAPGIFSRREFPPFDWWLADEPDFAALLERRPDGRSGDALVLIAGEGRGGEVARRLVGLRPGNHVLAFDAGAIPEDEVARPEISLACAGSEARLVTLRLPETADRVERVSRPFAIPAGCNWQWLRLSQAGRPVSDSNPWIARLSISPAR